MSDSDHPIRAGRVRRRQSASSTVVVDSTDASLAATAAMAGYRIGMAIAGDQPRVAPGTRNAALDALNAALVAAEKHLYELNVGVEASTIIDSKPITRDEMHMDSNEFTILHWGKLDGGWCLWVGQGPEDEPEIWSSARVHQTNAYVRERAALGLPHLMEQIRKGNDDEVQRINEATKVALAFARGEYDHE